MSDNGAGAARLASMGSRPNHASAMTRPLTSVCVAAAAAALGMASVDAASAMQQAQPDAQAPVAHAMADLRPGRIVLLREGSVLVQTTGVLRRNDQVQWVFVIDLPERDRELELRLLPSSTLEEMQRIAESIDDQALAFEATGEVFVYENRNYFLPTHAPHIIETRDLPEGGEESDEGDDAETDETSDAQRGDDAPTAEEDDSITSIMQRLEEKTGPIARSSADEPDAGRIARDSAAVNGRALREGTTLVDRRGHLTRGEHGSWVFVFDADAEGLGDPPVIVLPCLMLERMQRYARQHSNVAPMQLSGRVFEYQGRRYVLPTLYRVPRNRTPIVP